MSNYFYDMLPAEEMQQLSYIPTMAEFVEWIGAKYVCKVELLPQEMITLQTFASTN